MIKGNVAILSVDLRTAPPSTAIVTGPVGLWITWLANKTIAAHVGSVAFALVVRSGWFDERAIKPTLFPRSKILSARLKFPLAEAPRKVRHPVPSCTSA